MGEKNPPLSPKTRTRPLEAQLAVSALVPHEPITTISSCSRGRCPRPTPAWAAALGPALSACGYLLAQLCSNPLSPGLRWLTSVWLCAHQTCGDWTEYSFCLQAQRACARAQPQSFLWEEKGPRMWWPLESNAS